MAVVMDHDTAEAMEQQRGYADIAAADVWLDWLQLQDADA